MAVGVERQGLFRVQCPYQAGRPSIRLQWRSVGFVHWDCDPAAVDRLLPSNLQPDLYGGRAWVGYQFVTVTADTESLPRIVSSRRLPWGSLIRRAHYHEARVVTCVVDRFGLPGVWNLSVDTDSSAVARLRRRVLNQDAHQSEARFWSSAGQSVFWTQRGDGTTARLKITRGNPIRPTDIDRFLTARWRTILPPRPWVAPAESRWVVTVHDQWRLHRAAVDHVDDDALIAAGLPPVSSRPQALWSPGVAVEIGLPRRD